MKYPLPFVLTMKRHIAFLLLPTQIAFFSGLMSATPLAAQTDVTLASSHGPVGFCNYNDGINGITGGMGGDIVRVSDRTQLAQYLSDDTPRIILLEGRLEGAGLQRTKDVLQVGSNKTLIGVGSTAELAGIGLNVNGKQNIIIRNLTIHHADPDGIACRNTHHVWVDHCNIYSQDEADLEDWDGLIDLTVGSSYLTVSYCYIHDHHKCCLLNSGTQHFEDNGKNRATYHHNVFMSTDQRNPRIGYGLGHVFNNYYEKIGSYCIGAHTQARVLSENNYFSATAKNPFCQMYATSIDDASCAFMGDCGSYYDPALNFRPADNSGIGSEGGSGMLNLTGTSFDPAWWYDYDNALDATADVPSLYPALVGPIEGLENEVILWPGNGATDVPTDVQLKWSKLPDETSSHIVLGSKPDELCSTDIEELTLHAATTYYWQVKTVVGDTTYLSPVYKFTTASAKASKPRPADGETNAQLRAATSELAKTTPMSLSWRPAAEVNCYLVSLWDASGKAIISNERTTSTSINPGTLRYGEPYTWRVDVMDDMGQITIGDLWSFSAPACPIAEGRTEMEHLARSAYAYLEREDGAWFKASNDSVTVGEAGPGAMTGVFDGQPGEYEMSVTFYDEKAGQAWMGVSVNDVLLDSWTGSKVYQMTTHTLKEHVTLERGDQIRIDFYTQSKMRCRIDCIDLKLITASLNAIEDSNQTVAPIIYNMCGQRLAQPTGICIINGHKVNFCK